MRDLVTTTLLSFLTTLGAAFALGAGDTTSAVLEIPTAGAQPMANHRPAVS